MNDICFIYFLICNEISLLLFPCVCRLVPFSCDACCISVCYACHVVQGEPEKKSLYTLIPSLLKEPGLRPTSLPSTSDLVHLWQSLQVNNVPHRKQFNSSRIVLNFTVNIILALLNSFYKACE